MQHIGSCWKAFVCVRARACECFCVQRLTRSISQWCNTTWNFTKNERFTRGKKVLDAAHQTLWWDLRLWELTVRKESDSIESFSTWLQMCHCEILALWGRFSEIKRIVTQIHNVLYLHLPDWWRSDVCTLSFSFLLLCGTVYCRKSIVQKSVFSPFFNRGFEFPALLEMI